MDHNYNLNKLVVFKEVVQAGSFTKAALNLKQPKSRISRIVSSLEKELGMQLIYRTTRQFQLSDAGEELFNRIAPLLNEIKNSLEFVTSESEDMAGTIRVTSPEDVGSELMAKLCQEFMELYPKIQISLHASTQLLDLVKESIDVSIRVSKSKDSTLIQKKIGQVQMIFIMSPNLFQKYKPRKLEDLEKIPFLVFDAKNLKSTPVKVTNSRETKTIKPRPSFGSNNFGVLRAMALNNSGFALVPAFLVQDYLNRGELIHVCKEWRSEGTPIQILIPHQKEVSKKIRKFIDFIAPRLMQYF